MCLCVNEQEGSDLSPGLGFHGDPLVAEGDDGPPGVCCEETEISP